MQQYQYHNNWEQEILKLFYMHTSKRGETKIRVIVTGINQNMRTHNCTSSQQYICMYMYIYKIKPISKWSWTVNWSIHLYLVDGNYHGIRYIIQFLLLKLQRASQKKKCSNLPGLSVNMVLKYKPSITWISTQRCSTKWTSSMEAICSMRNENWSPIPI